MFSISDVILSGTLLVNAAAILNFKFTAFVNRKKKSEGISFEDQLPEPEIGDKVRDFLQALQYFRVFIGMWNLFVLFLMMVFFGS